MKHKQEKDADTMRDEYELDYSKAVTGKYFERLMREGSNVVVLKPDIAEVFRDSASVNEALRNLIEVSKMAVKAKSGQKQKSGASKTETRAPKS